MKHRRRLARKLLAAWFAITGPLLCAPVWAAFTASVDRTQLAAGESVQLTLQSDRSGSSDPELAPLQKDFEILSRSTSNSLQILNGSMSSQRQVQLVLSPRRSGLVEVPRLAWDGESSAAIELSVAAHGAGTGASGAVAGALANAVAHVFLTTSLDSLQPYVQSAVSLKVQLYSDKKLYQASLDLQGTADVLVRRLGEDVTRQETRNGRPYQVVTRHYLLVPQRSGDIQIDGPVLNAQVADASGRIDPFLERMFGHLKIEGGLGGTRPLRLRGDALKLVAQPRPPALRTGDWLPAQQLTLEDTWRPADKVIAVGQPLTRQLRIAAVGQSASQLPDLSALAAMPAGLKSHAEEATLSDQLLDGHVVGQRDQDVVVLADQPGRYELPELRLAWWDVVSNQRREAVLPAATVEVVPAANPASGGAGAVAVPPATTTPSAAAAPASSYAAASSAAPAPSGITTATDDSAKLWAWVSLAFALLWLATLGAWAWTHHRRHRTGDGNAVQPTPLETTGSAARASAAFQQACRDHAARPARDALIAWARATWPHDAPVGLNALARRLDNPVLTELLRELDRACIANTAWNGDALARSLTALEGSGAATSSAPDLPGLYSGTPR
ncbi:MAG: BatD family protein [Burkholderiales bacterium]